MQRAMPLAKPFEVAKVGGSSEERGAPSTGGLLLPPLLRQANKPQLLALFFSVASGKGEAQWRLHAANR